MRGHSIESPGYSPPTWEGSRWAPWLSLLPPLAWLEFGQLREGAGSPYLPILMNEMIHRGLLPGATEAWS